MYGSRPAPFRPPVIYLTEYWKGKETDEKLFPIYTSYSFNDNAGRTWIVAKDDRSRSGTQVN
jgi:hypothetical protein